MASTNNKPASRETLYAIIGSLVVAVILATLLVGSPFHALGLAYFDYSHEPGVVADKPATPPAGATSAAPK